MFASTPWPETSDEMLQNQLLIFLIEQQQNNFYLNIKKILIHMHIPSF